MSATTDDASRDAHARLKPNATNLLRARILLTLNHTGTPYTFDRISQSVQPASPSGVRTRTNELVKLGLVEAAGRNMVGKTLWRLTLPGSRLRDVYRFRGPRDLAQDSRIWFDQRRVRRIRFGTVLVDPALIPTECQPADIDGWVDRQVRITIDLLE